MNKKEAKDYVAEVERKDCYETIAALREQKAELIAALESALAFIEEDMGEWYSVQFAHLPVRYANLAHIRDGLTETLARVKGIDNG